MSAPKQLEIAGADDFNLVGDTAAEYVAPAKGDDATADLFASGPVAAWVAQSKAERDAVDAERRRRAERAEAIRLDLANG